MNKEELEKRNIEMSARAKAEIAKSGVVQFKLEPAKILKLYETAAKNKQPVGAILREWVLERLERRDTSAHKRRKTVA